MKVVINDCYGGFGISNKAGDALVAKGWSTTDFNEAGGYENPEAKLVCKEKKRDDLSNQAVELFGKYSFISRDSDPALRSHPDLVAVVKEIGDEASNKYGELKVVEIPDGTDVIIEEYDGMEWIAERHQTWS